MLGIVDQCVHSLDSRSVTVTSRDLERLESLVYLQRSIVSRFADTRSLAGVTSSPLTRMQSPPCTGTESCSIAERVARERLLVYYPSNAVHDHRGLETAMSLLKAGRIDLRLTSAKGRSYVDDIRKPLSESRAHVLAYSMSMQAVHLPQCDGPGLPRTRYRFRPRDVLVRSPSQPRREGHY